MRVVSARTVQSRHHRHVRAILKLPRTYTTHHVLTLALAKIIDSESIILFQDDVLYYKYMQYQNHYKERWAKSRLHRA